MGFFKNLFGKEEEPFIPTPTQHVSGLEPIVVQAVEALFSNSEDQKYVFKDLLEKSEIYSQNTLVLLFLLRMGEGKIEEHRRIMGIASNPADAMNIIRDTGFFKMKDAEKWVRKIMGT